MTDYRYMRGCTRVPRTAAGISGARIVYFGTRETPSCTNGGTKMHSRVRPTHFYHEIIVCVSTALAISTNIPGSRCNPYTTCAGRDAQFGDFPANKERPRKYIGVDG